MPTQTSSAHFFLSWAKERIDEMDARLASLEIKAVQMQAQARAKADQFIVQMKNKRDEFESTVRQQAEAGEPAWKAPNCAWQLSCRTSSPRPGSISRLSAMVWSSNRRSFKARSQLN